MNKKEAFDEINQLQDTYIDELIELIHSPEYTVMKTINFTSPTGTGKTKMMSKLINKCLDYYFIITTLSKGQLHLQIKDSLKRDCKSDNFTVYGSADYKINSKLEAKEIIEKIPNGKKSIWLRDEGHIKTNRYEELLKDVCYKVINFSATNVNSDILCNFSQTMMLRTVNQTNGTPEDAILKLLEVKEAHKKVKDYNPCAIFRCVGNDKSLYKNIICLCKKFNLKYIDITEDAYVMADLCQDNNEYDVIINKFKIVEGIDIRRAHVLYMDTQPGNSSTTIQIIGRCRRNALLYREDIDIMDIANKELLEKTRECYVFYNVENMRVSTDEDGELQYAFCNYVSCEALKAGTSIDVVNGQLANGLYIIELLGKTGKFNIIIDEYTGFNIVEPVTEFYDYQQVNVNNNYLYSSREKINVENVHRLPLFDEERIYDEEQDIYITQKCEPYYRIRSHFSRYDVEFEIPEYIRDLFLQFRKKYTSQYIYNAISDNCIDVLIPKVSYDVNDMQEVFLSYQSKKGYKRYWDAVNSINTWKVNIDGFDYKLEEVCSVNEIVLIKYHLILTKDKLYQRYDNRSFIYNYVYLKTQYYSQRYAWDKSVKKFFSNVDYAEYSSVDIEHYLEEYLEINIAKPGYKKICNMFEQLTSGSLFYEIRNVCDGSEINLLKYAYIQERDSGVSDKKFINKINDYMHMRYLFNLARNNEEEEKLAYILLSREVENVINQVTDPWFSITLLPGETLNVDSGDIESIFDKIDRDIKSFNENTKSICCSSSNAIFMLNKSFENMDNCIKSNIIQSVHYDFSSLFEEQTENDIYLIKKHFLNKTYEITEKELSELTLSIPYVKVFNDKESALIGTDQMRQIKTTEGDVVWIESKAVSSKVSNYNKLNRFITKVYADELKQAESQYIRGKNEFNLDKRCNSMIGYCVEYYSKYLVYGENYLGAFIKEAQHEIYAYDVVNDFIVIRACMLKYKEMMIRSFGIGTAKVISAISLQALTQEKYSYFVNVIVELGRKTAEYVMKTLYADTVPKDNIDPDLSTKHIVGLADYITEDTILDVKVRNYIDERCVRQVLAYHYLSTKRSDVSIKRVIVYDAVSGKSVNIQISPNNIPTHNM